jgi:hypothetical protein
MWAMKKMEEKEELPGFSVSEWINGGKSVGKCRFGGKMMNSTFGMLTLGFLWQI